MITDMRVSRARRRRPDRPAAKRRPTAIRQHLDRVHLQRGRGGVETTAPSLAQLGVYGPQAAAVVARALALADGTSALDGARRHGQLPRSGSTAAGVVVMRSDDAGVAGFDLVVDAAVAAALRSALHAAGAVDVDASDCGGRRASRRASRGSASTWTTDTIPLEAGIEDRAISQTQGLLRRAGSDRPRAASRAGPRGAGGWSA